MKLDGFQCRALTNWNQHLLDCTLIYFSVNIRLTCIS